jgi:2-dehydro-3-deoxygalactonokinase
MSGLLALDWGTSSLRGALIDGEGRVVEERSFARGILSVPEGGFPAVFGELFGDWAADLPLCLISGMAGSKQGWMEAPYCACPAGFADIAAQLMWLPESAGTAMHTAMHGDIRTGIRTAIVPGLCCEHHGVPDVMRGEEVQVFGALDLLGLEDATLVLPGTHSKWVRVRASRIEDFSSFMTGEIYALLRGQSILSRLMPPEGNDVLDEDAFRMGLRNARVGSLLSNAFSARTLGLFDRIASTSLPSYLSGLVIGEEFRAQGSLPTQLVLAGSDALVHRYALAAAEYCVGWQVPPAHATWAGLARVASTITASR